MPTPIQRDSLTVGLEQRYNTQQAGGAFDAKKAGTSTAPSSIQAKQFENSDTFVVDEQQGVSDFKNDGNNLSVYVQGLDTTKYKG